MIAKTAEVRDESAVPGRVVSEAADLGMLAQLLHALNQPLTGVQCSLELALAGPRSPEQYIDCIRGGLELIERMRDLAAAMRQLLEIDGAGAAAPAKEEELPIDLRSVLRETLDELRPVVEAKGVRVGLNCGPLAVLVEARGVVPAMFRLLESALSLAAPESVFLIENCSELGCAGVRIRWSRGKTAPLPDGLSKAELGLMLAQAGLRRAGVAWTQERTEDFEEITLRAPARAGIANECARAGGGKLATVHRLGEIEPA
ncbi:MAG: hypothetical protein WB562_07905 [Candidatus Sulfotelmatobacter sp.]